jgi:PEP-CTERM motif
LISGLDFTLSTGAATGTLASSSGQQITVNGGGTFVFGSTVATGWGLNGNVSGGLQLDALGFIGPKGLIIGPPGGSTYRNANGSIAGNGPHNPFLNQTATFVVNVTGVTASTSITGATFLFGTTPGANLVNAPEPSTISLFLIGLGFLVVKRKRIVPSFQ